MAQPSGGLLPYWLHFTAFLSLTSTLQCYIKSDPYLIRRLYTRAAPIEPTGLASRLFGTWNLLSTVVRISAGLNIHEKSAYDLGLLTFVVALAHFGWEWQVADTVGGRSLFAAEVTPMVSVVWMAVQRRWYLGT